MKFIMYNNTRRGRMGRKFFLTSKEIRYYNNIKKYGRKSGYEKKEEGRSRGAKKCVIVVV